ncbi:MAG: nucleoside triphosphate pyrophosphohydrolase [Chloroflexi bacterium]|nr:nucleoside triphosphate pyrophosphohydrolase [Chloroflexota bacterium]
MQIKEADLKTFSGLRRVVATLRRDCPWDRIQTHESLRPFLLEEASETLAALDVGDPARLAEELGDLLLEVLLHVQIGEEMGEFTFEDVVYAVASKLVRRHPHVFGDVKLETPQEVVEQWEELKREERGSDAAALDGVPETLPALAQAQALQRRAVRAGFAWENVEQAWEALSEEMEELRQARTPEARREELGDCLFALAELGRRLEADAEEALRSTCRGFKRLFQRMETRLQEKGRSLQEMTLAEKLAAWEEAKRM